jgi:hypothetical protein
MYDFYNIAEFIANSTRDFIQRSNQPEGAGCILVHFEVHDKNFAKSYFNEECTCVSYPFPLEDGGSMVSNKTQTIKRLTPYYAGLAESTVTAVTHVNHFGICTMLVTTELYTSNSHSEVTTDGSAELSGFATGYQFHKCATANVCARTTNKLLFKIVVAISSEHDDEMRNSEINRRTLDAVSNIADYLCNICGEYCTISVNR